MARYYYALWIPVLQPTRFEIIGHPKDKTLQDSKEFSRYTIRGELEKGTFHFSLFYKEGKKEKEERLDFRCEDKCNTGILVYSCEIDNPPANSLEERLQSKMPTFIYHYIKDYFHRHIHHHPSHDSLLHAYFSSQPLSLSNATDRVQIMEHYATHYLRKFRAHTDNAQLVFAIAKQNINSRLFINKGIEQFKFLLNEGCEILGEAEFCQALIKMETDHIAEATRNALYKENEQIGKLQQQVSFAYNLCTASYGIKLGYWGVLFGIAGILISVLSSIISITSKPDYSPILNRMDSIEREREILADSLVTTGQKEIMNRLDSIDKQLKNFQTQSYRQWQLMRKLSKGNNDKCKHSK